jgi:hypothetical protein
VSKKKIKAPDEPKFKGRPPKAVMKKVREKRLSYAKKLQQIDKVSKLDDFIEAWLKNNGNATQAAMEVFDCKSRSVAASVGSEYLKKAKGLVRLYMEEQGYTYGKMIQVAAEKMQKSKNTDWWDRLMKLGGYEDFMTKKEPAVSVNIMNAQKDILKGYVQEIDVEEAEES